MILVLRALGVGDLAAGVPAVRGLRAAFPDRTLALAAPAWLTPLIALIGGVDRIIPTDGLSAPLTLAATGPAPASTGVPLAGPASAGVPLAGPASAGVPFAGPAAPEVAVNLHGSGPESHRLLSALRPARLWAFANAEAGHPDGPAWVEEEHEVERWCRLLSHYDVRSDPADLSLAVPPAPVRRRVTIIHPGAKSPSRRWPVARFAAVARALAGRGHDVVVTGSAGERELARRVARAAGLPPPAVLAGATRLDELAALVAHARLLVSGDTGIAHLATAYGTPSVVLFGPVPPSRWGPPPERASHRAIWHGTRAERGDTLDPGVHPALLGIGVDEVLAAAGEVEGARRAVTP